VLVTQQLPPVSVTSLIAFRDAFTKELVDARDRKETSLAFVRHKLPSKPLVTTDEPFQVIVIGGRNARSATVTAKGKAVTVLDSVESETPIFQTKEDVYAFFEKLLIADAATVALNFAYPMRPVLRDGRLDGVLLRATKEHTFTGMIDEIVGKTLEEYIQEKQKRSITITLANDTVCLVLAGVETVQKSSLVGCVVGSGINMCIFLDDSTIVNVESGNFDKFEATATGKIVDEASQFVGKYRLEKETSGAYLFQHFNILVKQGVVDHSLLSSTRDLSFLAAENKGGISTIAKQLLERSASFFAAKLAGVYAFKKQEKLTVVAEGSLYWHGYGYKEHVASYLETLGVPKGAVSIIQIDDSSIVGAAELAL
jgi:hexokinase